MKKDEQGVTVAGQTPASQEEVEFDIKLTDSMRLYGNYVNFGRAIPDIRDGLKPAHRHTLWGMNEMGAVPGKSRVKGAQAIGHITGRYHPHGTAAAYGTMVGMAQPYGTSVSLIEGQGNWGTLSDPPAAERYTECRLTPEAMLMLGASAVIDGREIAEDGVPMMDNYTGTLTQPIVLPAQYPNLVVNGYEGIGLGVAGKASPHNLGETLDAAIILVDSPNARVDTILRALPGPDLFSGCDIFDLEGIHEYMTTGYGRFVMRAKFEVVETKQGRTKIRTIEITGLPHKVSGESVLEGIARLQNQEKLSPTLQVMNLTTSVNNQAIEHVSIELGKDDDPDDVIQRLLYHSRTSRLQETFSVNNVVVHENKVQTVSVIDALRVWLDHRRAVIKSRTEYRLDKALARVHILEGFIKAVPLAQEIVAIAQESESRQAAADAIIAKWGFSEIQTAYILDMTIAQITKMNAAKYSSERTELLENINHYEAVLNDHSVLNKVLKQEIRAVRSEYSKDRNCTIQSGTHIVERPTTPAVEIPATNGYLAVTSNNGIRWAYKQNISAEVGNEYLVDLQKITDQNTVEMITNWGWHVRAHAGDLPDKFTSAKVFAKVEQGEEVVFVRSGADTTDGTSMVMVTSSGKVKRIGEKNWTSHRIGKAYKVIPIEREEETVVSAFFAKEDEDIFILTKYGVGLRMSGAQFAARGDAAGPLPGISFRWDTDEVIWAGPVTDSTYMAYVTHEDKVSWFNLKDVPVKGRNTQGIICVGTEGLTKAFPITGDVISWYDGTEVTQVDLSSDPGKLGVQDSRIKTKSKGISRVSAVWDSPTAVDGE